MSAIAEPPVVTSTPPPNTIYRYGIYFPDHLSDLDIECLCYMRNYGPASGHSEALGPYWHARKAIDMLWNYQGSTQPFVWTPWAEKMVQTFCRQRKWKQATIDDAARGLMEAEMGTADKPEENCALWEALFREQYIGLAGCASSGKTAVMAVWSIFNFRCAPIDTKVIVTSSHWPALSNRLSSPISAPCGTRSRCPLAAAEATSRASSWASASAEPESTM